MINHFYQTELPLILTALLQADLINVGYLTACLYQAMNNVANGTELLQKSIMMS